jgi:hypothetical protein
MDVHSVRFLSFSIIVLAQMSLSTDAQSQNSTRPTDNIQLARNIQSGADPVTSQEWTKDKLEALIERNRRDEERVRAILEQRDPKFTARAAAKKADSKKGEDKKAEGISERFQKRYLRELGYPQEQAAKPMPAEADPCDPQRLFIRADPLDNYLYGITPASKAKGASVTYTDDRLTKQKTATINGMLSYVLLRDLCPTTPGNDIPFVSGYAVAPWVLANGNLTEPQSKKEKSSLQFGVEAQIEVSQLIWPRQVFTASPYIQTDFRGEARATGIKGYWDVYDAGAHIGGYIDNDPYLGWFIQLRGETDFRNVSNPGLTGLTKTDYAWIGGTARLSLFFLPSALDVPEAIRNRFSFIASVDYFHDMHTGADIRKYVATLKYNLNVEGTSSLALEYTKGTNKDTMERLNQYVAKLVFAY